MSSNFITFKFRCLRNWGKCNSRHFAKHIDKEHNVLIDLKDEAIHKTVGIVYKKNFEISNISAQFIEALIQYKF